MSRIVRMAKLSTKGGFSLFLGLTLSTIIEAVGIILVLRMLSPSEYGLVTIAMISPSLIGLFRDWGINFAMIKFLAQHRYENKPSETRKILASGLLFEAVLGSILTFTSFALAGFLTINVFKRPETNLLIQIASFTILAQALVLASQSSFTGFERMEFYSIILILQSSLRTLLAPLLIFFGYGALGAVLGTVLSVMVSGATGVLILYFIFFKSIHNAVNAGPNLGATLKTMFGYGLPLSVSTILNGFLSQFYSFVIAIYCSNLMIGNYKAAINFAVLLTFFTVPITTMLFPAFSKLNIEKETETLKTVFQYSVKYAALFVVPATVAIMVLSKALVFVLLPQYTYTPIFLTFYAINHLYTGLGSLSLQNFLNSQGKTRVTMLLNLITLAMGIPLSYVLVPRLGVFGLIFTTLIARIPSLTTGLGWIKKHFNFTIDWSSSAKIYLSSGVAAAITYITLSLIGPQSWMELLLGGTVFLITYLIATPLTGAVKGYDINNLREMLSALGPFTSLFNLLLVFIEKILEIKKRVRSSGEPTDYARAPSK